MVRLVIKYYNKNSTTADTINLHIFLKWYSQWLKFFVKHFFINTYLMISSNFYILNIYIYIYLWKFYTH